MSDYSVYIHIPFCRGRCVYCDFVSNDTRQIPDRQYTDAVLSEWAFRRDSLVADAKLKSVYLGGGTPSLFSVQLLAEMVLGVVDTVEPVEVTVEINPGDVDAMGLETLVKAGVNRFSLGAQAMNDERLKWLGRRHSVSQIAQGMKLFKGLGTIRTSADFIYATPGQTPQQMSDEIRRLCELGVDHFSAYELTVAENTPLASRRMLLPSEGMRVELWHRLNEVIKEYGMERYEVSNYATPGKRSEHNCHYWRGGEYVGLGSGAHGFVLGDRGGLRYGNGADLFSYFRCVAKGNGAVRYWGNGFEETLSDLDMARERVMLGLRWVEGIDVGQLNALLEGNESFRRVLQEVVDEGFLLQQNGHLVPTAEAMLLADTLALRFF